MRLTVSGLDHVALRIPAEGVEQAIEFYGGVLGLELENVERYTRGDLDVFSIRLSETALIHLQPVAEFEPPTDQAYDHVAIALEESIDRLLGVLRANDIEIETQADRLGATGIAPAVYIRDPFGYRIELKTADENHNARDASPTSE